MSAIDKKINQLRPNESVEISRYGNTICTAERSADGKTLRFVRSTKNGFEVFKTCRF